MSFARQFFHFAAVGLCGTAVQYLTLWGGVEYVGAPAAAASGCGYLLGSVVNYFLNYFLTFKSEKSHTETAVKYYTVLGIGWCINTSLMTLLVHRWGWQYFVAQVLTTGIGFIWNFSGSRFWAFKPQADKH